MNELIEKETNNFYYYLSPFSYNDVNELIKITIEIKETGQWAAKQIEYQALSLDINSREIDPITVVYTAIAKHANLEINELTEFEIIGSKFDFYINSNYSNTSYDFNEELSDYLKNILIENKIEFNSLSVKTQWFLNKIQANY